MIVTTLEHLFLTRASCTRWGDREGKILCWLILYGLRLVAYLLYILILINIVYTKYTVSLYRYDRTVVVTATGDRGKGNGCLVCLAVFYHDE